MSDSPEFEAVAHWLPYVVTANPGYAVSLGKVVFLVSKCARDYGPGRLDLKAVADVIRAVVPTKTVNGYEVLDGMNWYSAQIRIALRDRDADSAADEVYKAACQ